MSRRRPTSVLFALIAVAGATAGCGPAAREAPDLPQSVSPGWTRSAIAPSAVPKEMPAGGSPSCWKTDYTGAGTVHVQVCRYQTQESAFDAVQRTPATAQTVKFQEGSDFVLVAWNDTAKESLTALVRAIQKALGPKKT